MFDPSEVWRYKWYLLCRTRHFYGVTSCLFKPLVLLRRFAVSAVLPRATSKEPRHNWARCSNYRKKTAGTTSAFKEGVTCINTDEKSCRMKPFVVHELISTFVGSSTVLWELSTDILILLRSQFSELLFSLCLTNKKQPTDRKCQVTSQFPREGGNIDPCWDFFCPCSYFSVLSLPWLLSDVPTLRASVAQDMEMF